MFRASDTPDFLPEHGDMKFYSDWARRIAAGTWTDHQAFYGLPGYAYWLALIYTDRGLPAVPRRARARPLAEACHGDADLPTGSAGVHWAQARTHDPAARRRALARRRAGGARAGCSVTPAQAYADRAHAHVLISSRRSGSSCGGPCGPGASGRPSAGRVPRAGIVLMGVVAMMVANILFLIPLRAGGDWVCVADWSSGGNASVHRWSACGRGGARAGRRASFLGASPCALHNSISYAHEPVFLSAHSGINFFIGNNAGANGYPQMPAPAARRPAAACCKRFHPLGRTRRGPSAAPRGRVGLSGRTSPASISASIPWAWLRLLG